LENLVIEAVRPGLFLEGLPEHWDDFGMSWGVNEEHALRALAVLNGLELVRTGEATFEARETLPPRERIARIVAARPAHASDEDVRRELRERLADFRDPDAFLELVARSTDDVALDAGVVHAAALAGDARVRETLTKLAASDDPRRRFFGLFLLHELRRPRFP